MDSTLKNYQNETKRKLKIQFPTLTDQDLNFREGREKELMEMMACKLEMSYANLIHIIETL